MKKFNFRLQKVMDFREAMESLAKDAYLDARSKRFEAEAMVANIEVRRQELLSEPCVSLDAHQMMDSLMIRLDDEVRAQSTVISVLRDEEEHLLAEWHRAKQEFEALVKLQGKAQEAHQKEVDLEEQKELDEWSVTRRAA